jgi:phage terminase small subunit
LAAGGHAKTIGVAENETLNHRQRKFAELVAGGTVAKAAYFEAYPRCRAESTAERESVRLLKDPGVAATIEGLRRDAVRGAQKKNVLSKEERRQFLARVIRCAPAEVTEHDSIAQSYKVTDKSHEVKLPDKLRALELDAKLAGELKEQTSAGTGNGVTVIVSSGTLPSLQTGYQELRKATHGRN